MLIEIEETPNAYRPSQPKRVLALRCDVCNAGFKKPFTQDYLDHHKWGHFCSRKCYGAFRSAHPELYASNTALMHTPEVAVKISERVQERMAQPGYVHPWVGRHHTEETKERLSANHADVSGPKNGMWGRQQPESTRAKMSDAVTQRIIEGRFKPYGTRNVKGYHTSLRDRKERFFRSSWEHAVMVHLDAALDVVSWDYECVRIPYYYDDNKRWYVPDFLVTFTDERRELWEVKPKEFVDTEKNRLKTSAAQRWCRDNAISVYLILTGDLLRERGIIR